MQLPRIASLAALLIAGWPVLRWYVLRLTDGSDEPYGLAALVAALCLTPYRHLQLFRPLPPSSLRLLTLGLALYLLALPFAPPLLRALLFIPLLALVLTPTSSPAPSVFQRLPLAYLALLTLSLPLIASAQFYLGYPLRLLTAHLVAPLLSFTGHTVKAAGTTLLWAGERIIVDAPCSGIQMLWTGLFIAAVAACRHRLDNRASLTLLRRTALVVFVANLTRTFLLFFLETGLWPNPPGAHDAAGLVLFAASAFAIFALADRQSRPRTPAAV